MCVELSLLTSTGIVPAQSGLNWGYSRGHVCREDAYIAIRKGILNNNPDFFPSKSHNTIINVTWDDGTHMLCSLEATQDFHGEAYPKQISSAGQKSIIGNYLRSRINVINRPVTANDLSNYGRTSITVRKIDDENYTFDFSL